MKNISGDDYCTLAEVGVAVERVLMEVTGQDRAEVWGVVKRVIDLLNNDGKEYIGPTHACAGAGCPADEHKKEE